MKAYTVIFLMIISGIAYGQNGYNSKNNFSGLWLDDNAWNKSQISMANNPSANVGGSVEYVDVYGVITRDGDLTLGGGAIVTVYDTLWVNGDLTVGGSSNLRVNNTGLLIVNGNLKTDGGTVTVNEGRTIVKSNLAAGGGSDVYNLESGVNALYVYGDVSPKGGAEFNDGADPNILSETDLFNNDPSLYNYAMYGVLPVEFLYVNAVSINNMVKIAWATGSELNNDFFTIERSIDGLTFQEIGKVDGAGNSAETIEYNFEDYSPNNGVNYYRVKQTDFDGKYDYSVLVHIFNEQVRSLEVTAYPNPATDQLNVRVDGFGSEEVMIQLTDSRGMNVFSQTYDANFDNVAKMDVSRFEKGIYIVTLKSELYTLTKSVIVR
ncbi:T9SS type A sorting domain-containing protein [Fulvivirga sediminis]|uniref:T9SS type A sorting domain-containing protein n=1 Tax=Fulvivirga sediminis TaxID=2803949 RepID=A0A937JYP2_9BACT|nr:T9SS type A sorting domain-containing protein [Fulvivirga sediminis]MBL3656618.1 T9SS type A sorting domain-containing protein [Fulvivirga sediminis]